MRNNEIEHIDMHLQDQPIIETEKLSEKNQQVFATIRSQTNKKWYNNPKNVTTFVKLQNNITLPLGTYSH